MPRQRHSAGFPPWLKTRIPAGREAARVRDVLSSLKLNTVCGSAQCPNLCECFHRGTATFLIMGPNCTRRCGFCAVDKGPAQPLDPDEPSRVAEAAKLLGLKHVVVTSVTRDDLPDGGAAHFAAAVSAVRAAVPPATIEVLVPDFQGRPESVDTVLDSGPEVFNHNVETVPRLYPAVRPLAYYVRPLEVLRRAGARRDGAVAKSGIMVGLGETLDEVKSVFADLRRAGVGIVTVGQYLSPSRSHIPVARFVPPDEFAQLEAAGLAMGFQAVFSAPLVRSSYRAGEVLARSERSPHGR